MQEIKLKHGFEKVLSTDFLEKISEDEGYIWISDNTLFINHDLDTHDEDLVDVLENTILSLKDYFVEDFEIYYFTYSDEYTIVMYNFEKNKLLKNVSWIGDLCEDEDDENRNMFVEDNLDSIRSGYADDELLNILRSGLYTI